MTFSRSSSRLQAVILLAFCSCLVAVAGAQTLRDPGTTASCYPKNVHGDEQQQPYTSKQGVITVGCPKIWRSERVFTVLDGILRDVDSITLKALQDLDPNAANLAQIVSVVNDLQVKGQFNQATGINNALKLQQIKANRGAELQNAKTAQQANQALVARRDILSQESVELQKQELAAVKKGGADPAKNAELKAIQDQEATVQKQLGDINTTLAKPQISDASLSSDQGPTLTPPTTGTALNNLPDGFSKALQNALQQPTLPPPVQMDNVIELLHQRLAREFSVMYDDLTRQSGKYEVYLLQFDVGILPRHGAKDREAQVTFSFTGTDGDILAYELYPGMSNYNIMRGMDKTNRIGISGMAQSIIGFGLAASFNHERHELRSGLSQSLFVSGYGVGTNQFGWLMGPAPYENFLNPGNRILHALILVPHKTHSDGRVGLHVSYCWPRRELRRQWWWTTHPQSCSEPQETTTIIFDLPKAPDLRINKIAYVPAEDRATDGEVGEESESNYLLLSFEDPIDPNLVITANSKIINRVRDVRGRGMYGGRQEDLAGNGAEQAAVSGSRFGLLEKDQVDPDTWLQTSSNSLVMNISKTTAGTDTFPVITLAAPGAKAGELSDLLVAAANVRIGEWSFLGKDAFLNARVPLFTQTYGSGQIKAYVDEVDNSAPKSIRIITETPGRGRNRMVWLHEAAQVVLEAKDGAPKDPTAPTKWALKCDQERGSLFCQVPKQATDSYDTFPTKLKVWVDQPPYFGRPGLWADYDLVADAEVNAQLASAGGSSDVSSAMAAAIRPSYTWVPAPYVVGDWGDVRELAGSCTKRWCRWETSIKLKNLGQILKPGAVPARHVCILELTDESVKPRLQNWIEILNHSLDYSFGSRGAFKFDPLSKNTLHQGRETSVWDLNREMERKKDFVHVDPKTRGALTTLVVSVPFATLPALTERLHVGVCDVEGKPIEGDNPISLTDLYPISLPDLYPKVLPGEVWITHPAAGAYHIQGDHLRSVSQIRLEGEGEAIVRKTTVGFNSLDVFLEKPLKPGTYNVFAIIGGMTVPLQAKDTDKNLQPATIKVPDPKASDKNNDDTNAKGQNTYESYSFREVLRKRTVHPAPATSDKTNKAGAATGGGTVSGGGTPNK